MRNSKMKGFTLIELIVVIAIIGILAAILVPSMLGYVRNAKISSANAGAKQIHTAAASVLTQLGVSNFNFGVANQTATTDPCLFIAGTKVDWKNVTNKPKSEDIAIGSYLGDEFTGYGKAFFKTGTYSVSCAVYAEQEKAWNVVDDKTKTANDTTTYSEGVQKADAKAGSVYGIYPAPKTGTASTAAAAPAAGE